eukprot:6929664-Prymnesium_polylepis.2
MPKLKAVDFRNARNLGPSEGDDLQRALRRCGVMLAVSMEGCSRCVVRRPARLATDAITPPRDPPIFFAAHAAKVRL